MKQLSLIDKFKVLFDNVLAHPLFLILLLLPVIIFVFRNKASKKATRNIIILAYIFIISFVLFIGGDVLFDLFDNVMDALFMFLYFPNFITLFIVVILSWIIAFISLFSKKMRKINKVINGIGFGIIQIIFCLILTFIRTNKINIYADNALYSNSDLLTLMQLLIGTFSFQIIAVFIINGINKVTDVLDGKYTGLSKIKYIKINNDKVGYLNVIDKKKSKLKPFKFDVKKIESISISSNNGDPTIFDVSLSDKKYKPFKFDEGKVINLSEKVKDSKIKVISFAPNKSVYLDVKSNPKLKSITLNSDKDIYMEVSEPKLKRLSLKPNKNIYLELKPKSSIFKWFTFDSNKNILLNEKQKNPSVKMFEIDPLKNVNLNVKPKKYKRFNFDLLKEFVLNIKEKAFKSKKIDTSKDVILNAPLLGEKKPAKLKEISLDTHKQITMHEDKPNLVLQDEKPDLLKPMEPLVGTSKNITDFKPGEPLVGTPKSITDFKMEEPLADSPRDAVDKLNILNMQATMDAVIKYKLVRDIRLKYVQNSVNAVENLKIPNFNRSIDVLRKCRLYKHR